MKKLFFAMTLLLVTSSVMAQTKLEHCSLKEAIEKAKAENKMVMLINGTTWCGPCKALAKDVLPTKEAGDFLNDKFIVIKYELDVSDPDGIAKKFNIKAYPTMIYLNDKGEEVSRMLGGARDAKAFIDRVKESIKPENSFAARNERLKNDPSYALEHINFLKDIYMNNEADQVLITMFNSRTVEQNFDPKSVELYAKNINDLKSPIIQYMLTNRKEVVAVVGKKEYDKFLTAKTNAIILSAIMGRNSSKENTNTILAENTKMGIPQTSFSKFITDATEPFFAKDFKATLKVANKYMKKADSDSREKMLSILSRVSTNSDKKVSDENKAELIKYLTQCVKVEKDTKMIEKYQSRINNLTNADAAKKDGSIRMMRMQ